MDILLNFAVKSGVAQFVNQLNILPKIVHQSVKIKKFVEIVYNQDISQNNVKNKQSVFNAKKMDIKKKIVQKTMKELFHKWDLITKRKKHVLTVKEQVIMPMIVRNQ